MHSLLASVATLFLLLRVDFALWCLLNCQFGRVPILLASGQVRWQRTN